MVVSSFSDDTFVKRLLDVDDAEDAYYTLVASDEICDREMAKAGFVQNNSKRDIVPAPRSLGHNK